MSGASNNDPFRKVAPGELWNPQAESLNAMIDAARDYRARQQHQGTGAGLPPPLGIVTVRNISGAAVPRFGILALGAPIIGPDDNLEQFQGRVNFDGDEPASSSDRFCVLLEPLADDAIGRALVMGAVAVTIDVSDTGHEYAVPIAGETAMLESAASGTPILWKDSGTGEVSAYVLLGTSSGSGVCEDVAVVSDVCIDGDDTIVEYSRVNMATCEILDRWCVTNPGACCIECTSGEETHYPPKRMKAVLSSPAGCVCADGLEAELYYQTGWSGPGSQVGEWATWPDPASVQYLDFGSCTGGGGANLVWKMTLSLFNNCVFSANPVVRQGTVEAPTGTVEYNGSLAWTVVSWNPFHIYCDSMENDMWSTPLGDPINIMNTDNCDVGEANALYQLRIDIVEY